MRATVPTQRVQHPFACTAPPTMLADFAAAALFTLLQIRPCSHENCLPNHLTEPYFLVEYHSFFIRLPAPGSSCAVPTVHHPTMGGPFQELGAAASSKKPKVPELARILTGCLLHRYTSSRSPSRGRLSRCCARRGPPLRSCRALRRTTNLRAYSTAHPSSRSSSSLTP